jgi:XTP/dITP diphosphohydrolase
MIERLIFATKNKHKMIEIREILAGLPYEVVSMEDVGIDIDVIEDGLTFEENALKKAVEIMQLTRSLVLADDSGIEIDYLNKEPGIYSARYLGVDTPYPVKNQIILEKLKDAVGEERSARFVCVIAAAFPDGKTMTARGTIEGVIHDKIMGTNGFGYDPIFFVPEFNMTTAEMDSCQKNAISHRGKALRKMKEQIEHKNV